MDSLQVLPQLLSVRLAPASISQSLLRRTLGQHSAGQGHGKAHKARRAHFLGGGSGELHSEQRSKCST